MSIFVRAKRVTDPLDDKAKARLVGTQLSYVSSGSEHSADDSPCLSELVHGFLEDDSDFQSLGYESDSDHDDDLVADCTDVVVDIVRSATGNSMDSFRNKLLANVLKAMEMFSCLRNQRPVFRRQVMTFLRDLGYNAGICKTKWDSSGGLTAGNYEFIDVVQSSSTCQNRYIIDLDFASQFEIARPTSQYLKPLQSLPRVFVGRNEELKKIIKAMCDAARRSLKSKGLTIPPWRKNRYMQNKWLCPYRRTANTIPASSLTPVMQPVNGVKCRLVGFEDGVNGRVFVRTR
ncbi:uncharacterized protein LOC110627845 [Manihot esculenta]|uniref:Uncharacterized protein n=1 Tax=Manihot esculenta TaxID=3983 RepID=A0A2C9UTR5_MANES|nr:uncharacterized protein LOC110627845 [Manihot esculenta]OAY34844.1 hypothetical protein MANES_12G051200v8 [Manihot esculenta]